MKIYLSIIMTIIFICYNSFATIWSIGPARNYTFCSQIVSLVADGDTIEIDNSTYDNDKQVTWNKNNLYIHGINGKPKLKAGSIIANDNSNGKGIFVIEGNNTIVENIEFNNTKVVDHNGAGIRQEGSNLTVRHCTFNGNEMGILQGGTITDCKIVIEFCEFLNSGSPENPGYQHNIYINHIDTLIFRYNYTHDAIAEGHEFKSRANNNFILYNRISNINSIDSRNIDLPNGGTAIIMGNIIEQGQNSANSNIIGFGLEGLFNPGPHNFWVCNNTIVNKKTTGSIFNIASMDTLFLRNNIFVGAKTGGFIIGTPSVLDSGNNFIDNEIANAGFVNPDNYDYHLLASSPVIDAGVSVNKNIKGYNLTPVYMYKDEFDFEPRPVDEKIDIGAYEFEKPQFVNQDNSQNVIHIYPNPAYDFIEICVGTHCNVYLRDIRIYNIYGECVKIVETGLRHVSTERIDISDLVAGIYFVNYYWENHYFTIRLIVIK